VKEEKPDKFRALMPMASMHHASTQTTNHKVNTNKKNSPNKLSGAFHNWYRSVLGYTEDLVAQLLSQLLLDSRTKIIDPFCGSGTTLVECMKQGIDCVGIDANPASFFVSQVKTDWSLRGDRLLELCSDISERYPRVLRNNSSHRRDPTYIYLETSGMIERGWISLLPLHKAVALKLCILNLKTTKKYKNALMLALIAEVIHGASNVRFGPELYCGKSREDHDVLLGFHERVECMALDLSESTKINAGIADIFLGDSRDCSHVLGGLCAEPFTAVITSPPYPAEHDYTRNARLELAFLEEVTDRESLRRIKRRMIRSHTKGIYKGDIDAQLVEDNRLVQSIVRTLKHKVQDKNHGFARLYPKVVQEYFGGIKHHLLSIKPFLSPRSRCAYIVGDQSSYLQVHIPTAEIFSSVAAEVGFKTIEIQHWRKRWSTKTNKELDENILILEVPGA
jgi:hypothetical protein